MAKQYQQLLPLNTEDTIKNQFGWLPISVYRPGKGSGWGEYFSDDGDPAGKRRGENAKYLPGLKYSSFNPELAETIVRYWSVPGSIIIDPFSGRSTRGVVSTVLDRKYYGYEIVPQVAQKTKKDMEAAAPGKTFEIFNEDGCEMARTQDSVADLVFTCPPYHRLEKYEVVDGQLSNIRVYEEFLEKIADTATNIARVMKPGAFLCWVCADWRDGKAFRIFHKDSIDIFNGVGLTTHDIVIIHNNSPFARLQAGKVAAKRYTSKTHEYILAFRKPT